MLCALRRVFELRAELRLARLAEPEVEFTISPLGRMARLARRRFARRLVLFVPALASLVVHLLAMIAVGLLPAIEAQENNVVLLEAAVVPPQEMIVPPDPNLELARPSDDPHENVFQSLALASGLTDVQEKDLLSEIPPDKFLFNDAVTWKQDPLRAMLNRPTSSKGSVGEQVMHVEGAVDRITYEIATNLEESKVMVAWLMDASLSLVEERQNVADRLQRVYEELDKTGAPRKNVLTGAVIGFGQEWGVIVDPTTEGSEIVEGIRKVPRDESGVENVFSAVIQTVERYKPHITREKRKLMVVIWTDESGDDYRLLEQAVSLCQRFNVQVITVGPSAMFGKELGTRSYKHPEDGQVYQLPLSRGPEAVYQERLNLPYWFEGSQLDNLHAALGPFALTRLARETGGAYFIKDEAGDGGTFDLPTMLPYAPDYSSVPEYVHSVQESPLRLEVMKAVDLTKQRKFKPTPPMEFEPTGANYQQLLREGQEIVAYNTPTLEEALACFGKGMEEEYAKERSPRWRAWYDLTHGRLLAMKVRCDEYNWICAVMRGKGREFVDDKSNRWRFVPDEKLNFGSASQRAAAEAIRLLTRCRDSNPGTPWALLAERELRHPLGFKLEEAYVAPPPPPPARPNPVRVPPPPPPPPPPQGRRTEELNKLEKPKPVVLPKL
ncbi:MAG: VWA domain-containing protein [Planctomycetia bacterium]|nr:VWA domain-containing protein [Planctomycetia bacterium]